ncbi:MAG: polyphosphate kinase 2 [Pseudomonadota bacterium]
MAEKTKKGPLGYFDLENPDLAPEIEDRAFASGGYPYDKPLKRKDYEDDLEALQIELVKLQKWVRESGNRIVIVFEGRDAAGKGGTIHAFKEYMNPRHARVVALSKPTDREQGELYFQRYVAHLPTAGEIVFFDRSWYNRAGVEPVMGFCTPAEHEQFLRETPRFEDILVDDGIMLFKIWLTVGREMQMKRFHDRRHNPLKVWKLSPIDLKALDKWDDYAAARDKMLEATHSPHAPWTIVRSNDKRRARLNAVRYVLGQINYEGRDDDVIGDLDPKILGFGPEFLTPEDD